MSDIARLAREIRVICENELPPAKMTKVCERLRRIQLVAKKLDKKIKNKSK